MEASERYIWVEDAVREYHRSRDWFVRRLRSGDLRRYGAVGDKRIYLDRAAITALLVIRPVDNNPVDNNSGTSA